jgi:hypothetical protein
MQPRGVFNDAPDEIVARAVEHFGLTNDPREAGYVLPDGRMLDLSGRHQMLGGDYQRIGDRNVPTGGRDWQAGQRDTDHRELNFLDASSDGDSTSKMLEFQTTANAIRLNPGQGISVTSRPTRRQIEEIARMWNREFRGERLYIDIDHYTAGDARSYTPRATQVIERPNVENITRFFDEHFSSRK